VTEVSIVISTYERPTELARVLEGFKLQTFRDFEVVVADDGSGPETKAAIDRHRDGIRVIHERHEHDGFRAAAARNMGVRASSGKWIVFVDGDCVPFPDYLENVVRSRDAGHFLTGERYLLEKDEAERVTVETVASRRAFDEAPAREKKRLRSLALKNSFYAFTGLKPERPKLLTANCGVAREDLVRVNGLDERFRGWGREDDDLRRRLVRLGIRPKSTVGRANLLHLWHPPVASFKGTVRAGPNEPYFHRGFFLARCRLGLERRPLESVSIAVTGAGAEQVAGALRLAPPPPGPVEVELALDAGGPPPRWTRASEVRVLVRQPGTPPREKTDAHVVVEGGEGLAKALDEVL
jgi:glycosyltransferase involved in cell wall biosynthesis